MSSNGRRTDSNRTDSTSILHSGIVPIPITFLSPLYLNPHATPHPHTGRSIPIVDCQFRSIDRLRRQPATLSNPTAAVSGGAVKPKSAKGSGDRAAMPRVFFRSAPLLVCGLF